MPQSDFTVCHLSHLLSSITAIGPGLRQASGLSQESLLLGWKVGSRPRISETQLRYKLTLSSGQFLEQRVFANTWNRKKKKCWENGLGFHSPPSSTHPISISKLFKFCFRRKGRHLTNSVLLTLLWFAG